MATTRRYKTKEEILANENRRMRASILRMYELAMKYRECDQSSDVVDELFIEDMLQLTDEMMSNLKVQTMFKTGRLADVNG